MREATGLELNLFERAGYFVRRRIELDASAMERLVRTIADDLLGSCLSAEFCRETRVADLGGRAAGREVLRDPRAYSAQNCRSLWADVVLEGEYRIELVPGSHLDFSLSSGAGGIPETWVRVTLNSGDALFFCPGVMWRPAELMGAVLRCRFTAQPSEDDI
ncbi:MAG: hypothetical protein ACP5VE_08095 [Chthonomonadales bacterium]